MTSFVYTIPYLLSVLYLLVLMIYEFKFINSKETFKIAKIQWLVGIWFCFFFGLRGYILEDWTNYYPFFQALPSICNFTLLDNHYGFNLGFVYYTLLIKSIFGDYHIWIFISSLFDFCVLNWFLKRYSPYYVISFLLFISFVGISLEVDTMRNVKSIMFFLLSFPFLLERKFLPYLFVNLFGALWHTSSLFYIPFYFVLVRKYPLKWVYITTAFSFSFFLLHISVLNIVKKIASLFGGLFELYIRGYLDTSSVSSYGLSMGIVERVLSLLLVLVIYKKSSLTRVETAVCNIYICYFCIFMLFSSSEVLASRMSMLFIMGYWLFFPLFYRSIKKLKLKKQVILLFVLLIIMKIVAGTNKIIYKYDNLLFEPASVEERESIVEKYHSLQ